MTRSGGRARRAGLGAALAVAVVLSPVVPARAATPLPSDAAVVFQGRGWGHGRGMGQWGARGLSRAGKSHAEILKTYYAGTQLTTRDAESIRVLLSSGGNVVVTSSSPFRATAGGETAASSTSDEPYLRARASGGNIVVERSSSYSGPWASMWTGAGPAVLRPGENALGVVASSGSLRYYRGKIEARSAGTSTLRVINDVTLDLYLRGVVPREMPSSWEAEALKAQAVAARSYAVNKKIRARQNDASYDICATTSCQVYGGMASRSGPGASLLTLEASATNSAIQATAGQVLTYSGSAILAEYSSSTGGHTVAGSVAYLKAVPDEGDDTTGNPNHSWTGRVTVSEIEAAWPEIGDLTAIRVTRRDGNGEWGGRVLALSLDGTASSKEISGNALRGAFEWPARSNGLRSTWFRPVVYAAEVVSAPATAVNRGQSAPVAVRLRNTGTVSWEVGGAVRLSSSSPSAFAGPEWISPSTPVSVTRNVDAPSSGLVRPNQVAEFAFTLHTESMEVGAYSETFHPVAEDITAMNPSFTLSLSVTRAATTPGAADGKSWRLSNGFGGRADEVFSLGREGDKPVVGDWNGDGVVTPGFVRGNRWYLFDTFGGQPSRVFGFGRADDIPVVGDWNGDGITTVGVVRGRVWHVSDGFGGRSSRVMSWGRATDIPVAGDWDGNGTATPALVRGKTWFISNAFDRKTVARFSYGRMTDIPVAGDWDGDGRWTPGVVRGKTWFLTGALGGRATIVAIGPGKGRPVAGNWDGKPEPEPTPTPTPTSTPSPTPSASTSP